LLASSAPSVWQLLDAGQSFSAPFFTNTALYNPVGDGPQGTPASRRLQGCGIKAGVVLATDLHQLPEWKAATTNLDHRICE